MRNIRNLQDGPRDSRCTTMTEFHAKKEIRWGLCEIEINKCSARKNLNPLAKHMVDVRSFYFYTHTHAHIIFILLCLIHFREMQRNLICRVSVRVFWQQEIKWHRQSIRLTELDQNESSRQQSKLKSFSSLQFGLRVIGDISIAS